MTSKSKEVEFSELRKRAENAIKKKTGTLRKHLPRDLDALLQELEMHQVELEMQNEELRRARQNLEESQRGYADLFDFAPVGYFVLDRNGVIRNVGFSAHNEDVALRALSLYDFDTVLFPLNWALGICRGWGDRISAVVKEKGKGLLGMKSLVRRNWRDGEARPYPKSWCQPIWGDEALGVAAMKYAVAKGADTLVPPGNIEHFTFMLEHADECYNQPMTEDEWAMLRREAKAAEKELIF
jgi:predicted aldo/keto reductase-like oxidoreductase